MSGFRKKLAAVKRPKILIRAAEIASLTYVRSRDLSAILGFSHSLSTTLIILQLFDLEEVTNGKRLQEDASYDPKKHVQILSALLAEVNFLHEEEDQTKLSGTDSFFCET